MIVLILTEIYIRGAKLCTITNVIYLTTYGL
jgi:hypothetical protein